MNPNYGPHTFDKAPCPTSKKHVAPTTAQQSWEDYQGLGPTPQGRRARR